MKTIVNVPTKQSLIRETRDYLMIALGLILYGIGWTVFLLPNDITTGRSAGYRLHSLFRHRLPCAVHLFQYQPHLVTTLHPHPGLEVQYQNSIRRIHPDILPFHHSETGKRCGLTARSAFHGVRHRCIPLRRRHRHRFFFQW